MAFVKGNMGLIGATSKLADARHSPNGDCPGLQLSQSSKLPHVFEVDTSAPELVTHWGMSQDIF